MTHGLLGVLQSCDDSNALKPLNRPKRPLVFPFKCMSPHYILAKQSDIWFHSKSLQKQWMGQ